MQVKGSGVQWQGVREPGYTEGVPEDGDSVGRSEILFTERSVSHHGVGDPSSQQLLLPTAPCGSESGSQAGTTSFRSM